MRDWLSSLWYDFIWWLLTFILTLGFSLRIRGSRHIPPRGPALIIANHQSFLDPPLLGVSTARRLCFLARKTLFRHRVFALFIGNLNAVPVDQEGVAKEGLKTILEQLLRGQAVVVFPEGERTSDGVLHPLKPGVLLLIKRAQVPVVPVGIAGAYDAWPRWRKLPIPAPLFLPAGKGTLAVVVGRPIDSARLTDQPRDAVLAELFTELQKVQQQAEQLRRR